jgi:transposase
MSAAHSVDSTSLRAPVLYLAFELSWTSWKLAFTIGAGQPARIRPVPARCTAQVLVEIAKAMHRFRLPDDTPVVSCFEAGRDGFWLHRFLVQHGIPNIVVDSASIEVNRRKRRAKSDRLDAAKLVSQLVRWHNGEDRVWKVVHVPTVANEDDRQLHRELIELKRGRTELSNRIKGLLATLGLRIVLNNKFPDQLEKLRQWDGAVVPPGLKARLLREFERWQLIERQIRELESQRHRELREDPSPQGEQTRRLMDFRGIGPNGAWLLVREIFGWRKIRNVRELGSLAGLTPTGYFSGDLRHEQGISKAGNSLVRWMMIQLAWGWLAYQPQSKLSKWYERRFGQGNSRTRKVGIVALARKLLIALWKYLETGEVPEGAVMGEKVVLRVKKTNSRPATGKTGKKVVLRLAKGSDSQASAQGAKK